jgi:hypothetical protein
MKKKKNGIKFEKSLIPCNTKSYDNFLKKEDELARRLLYSIGIAGGNSSGFSRGGKEHEIKRRFGWRRRDSTGIF